MDKKPTIKIFVSHRINIDSEIINNPIYINVRCGAFFDRRKNINMLGDDTGENISYKRNSYCELTVLYWAWKNSDADYFGLCHYRRYFSFSSERFDTDIYGSIVEDYLDSEARRKYALEDSDQIYRLVTKYDIIVTEPFDVKKAPEKFNNLYEQYSSASPNMHKEDLDLAMQIIKNKYPDYYECATKYMESNCLYPANLFIMKKDIFNKYCEWLFSILAEIDNKLDYTDRNREETRAVGMIGERLLGVFLLYLSKENKEIKIGKFQRIFFLKPNRIEFPMPFYLENNIPIVFASSEYYAPYVAMAIYSMIKNANKNYYYDIVILSSDFSNDSKKKIEFMLMDYHNVKIRIFDITPLIRGRNLYRGEFTHATKESYYRLLILEIFRNFEKVIYLDSDLIILDDISKVYNIPIGNCYLAAVHDPDFMGEYKVTNPKLKEYIDKELKLDNPYNYFNAGVLVYNIKIMNKIFNENELIEFAEKNELFFMDQDVLNKKCENHAFYLDPKWNVMVDCGKFRVDKIISNAPIYIYENYIKSRKNPSIIHYAGYEKPWNNPASDFAEEFWLMARNTNFYEILISRLVDAQANDKISNYHNFQLQQKSVIKKLKKIFPQGSKRRKLVDKLLPKETFVYKMVKNFVHLF